MNKSQINMLKQQIRTTEVLDETVLKAMGALPRHQFVPETYRNLAYADMPIPLPHHQQMLTPREEAKLLQALALTHEDVVLEIGTGTGYLTGCLATLAAHVITIDYFRDFTDQAQTVLTNLAISNVTYITGNAASGWHEQAPFDVIVVTGAWPQIPQKVKEDLKVGGRLFCICGAAPAMVATLVTRVGRMEWVEKSLFETLTPELLQIVAPNHFNF